MKARKTNPPKDKTTLHSHAKRRARERYGISLNRIDMINIIELINQSDIMFESSNNRPVYIINYKNIEMIVVYDKKRRAITTFLPKDIWTVRMFRDIECDMKNDVIKEIKNMINNTCFDMINMIINSILSGIRRRGKVNYSAIVGIYEACKNVSEYIDRFNEIEEIVNNGQI